MNQPIRARIRALAIPMLALTLLLGLSASSARAQAPAPAPGEEVAEGRPYDGYFATGALAGGILFIVAKSARRS